MRKRRVYVTVLVDVETGRPVDLLPDRESATLAAWLSTCPGIEVVCRDRAPFVAEGPEPWRRRICRSRPFSPLAQPRRGRRAVRIKASGLTAAPAAEANRPHQTRRERPALPADLSRGVEKRPARPTH
ncbi:hypothetical protein ACGFWI_34255 [Streptomyces sp. NPDC048434]|uniref:hypothetical protein n=1 Tax=Streptomyces sp. NPDC048434 TaxID=3365549 RepID=UPI00371F78F5